MRWDGVARRPAPGASADARAGCVAWLYGDFTPRGAVGANRGGIAEIAGDDLADAAVIGIYYGYSRM